jgi:HEPN domain-containing protein
MAFFSAFNYRKDAQGRLHQTPWSSPPKLHNLAKLAKMAGITLEVAILETLLVANTFNIEGRYPEGDSSTLPDKLEARKIREETEELYQWLKNQL